MEKIVSAITAPLRPMVMSVTTAGDQVVARFGNVEVKTTYEDALLISHWLRLRAREANGWRGLGRLSVVGTLHDSASSDKRPKDTGIARARHIALIPKSSWHISSEPGFVVCKFGSSTMRLMPGDALTLAQWLRANAKEAKRLAGDLRHWSDFPAAHEKQNGPNVTRG